MADYNHLTLVGGIVEFSTGKYDNGEAYVKLNVGSRLPFGNKEQQYYSVFLGGKLAANADGLRRVLTPKRKILVTGTLVSKPYLSKDGTAKVENRLYAAGLPVLLDAPAPSS